MSNKLAISILLLLLPASISSQISPCLGNETISFFDHEYNLVEIGDQCWFAENVRTEFYSSGDFIPTNLSDDDWHTTAQGARAIFQNDPAYFLHSGYLYNYHAVSDPRGLCPSGFKIADTDDWDELISFVGGASVAGSKLKKSTQDIPPWDSLNEFGFHATPGGARFAGGIYAEATRAQFWRYTSTDATYGSRIQLFTGVDNVYTSGDPMNTGYNVRCVNDQSFVGCLDPGACNYNDLAQIDDASCDYSCCPGPGCCLNGTVWDYELQGCVVAIPTDIDLDGCTGAGDVLEVLANFGQCLGGVDYIAGPCFPLENISHFGVDYELIEAGGECWFKSGLNATAYRDGTPILNLTSDGDWSSTSDGAYCYYNNAPSASSALYNFYAIMHPEGVCPSGFHVPQKEEWDALIADVNGSFSSLSELGFAFANGTRDAGSGDFAYLSDNAHARA